MPPDQIKFLFYIIRSMLDVCYRLSFNQGIILSLIMHKKPSLFIMINDDKHDILFH